MLLKVAKMLAFAVIGGLLSAVGGAWAQIGREPIDWATVSIESIGGEKLDTAELKGKIVLLVNTASFCGFTGQYKDLEALYRRYEDKGLVVLGVPSNDFGEQEPGSNAEIKKFCEATYEVTFPLADKQVVSGDKAHPLYRWAARQTGPLGAPNWNFHKILIGRDGRIVDWFTALSGVGPKLDRAIQAALSVQT
ncbi:MAG TPA: glutathione peroxidase [Reyranella sp.]|nr:glutathione peroxidase [Reyranella sp.]